MAAPKYWTIAYINEQILWLLSDDCAYEEKQKKRLIRIAMDIKQYMQENGIKRIRVYAKNKDYGSKGYEIVKLT